MFTPAFFFVAAAVAVVSYLLGSINCAIIVSKTMKKDDVRKYGSGNAGMTNILRTYGKGPAAITAAGDLLKAVAAIVLARFIFGLMEITAVDAGQIAGLFVVLGHVHPLYFGFRGGKGVITTLGVIMLVNPLVFLILAAVFVPFVFITKIVSLTSILGSLAYPVLTWGMAVFTSRPPLLNTLLACVYSVVIIWMHRTNIKRLLNGTEHKFGTQKQ